MKKNHTIQYFEAAYPGSFPIGNYYLDSFNKLPNILDYENVFDTTLCEEFDINPYLEKIHESAHMNLNEKVYKGKSCTYKSKQDRKFLITLGDNYDGKIHRVSILYDNRDDVEFCSWASVEDVRLVEERARLKRCIDEKLLSTIERKMSKSADGEFNAETKRYGK